MAQSYLRSNSHQADSINEETCFGTGQQIPNTADKDVEAAAHATSGLLPHRGRSQTHHRMARRVLSAVKRKRALLASLAVAGIFALLLIQLSISVSNYRNLSQLMLHLPRSQTPGQVVQSPTQPPVLQQVPLANFILDPLSAPSCHGNGPVQYPCWDGRRYITSGSLGRLTRADEAGERWQELELAANQTEIRVLRDGAFGIEAQVRVRLHDSAIPSISGKILVNGVMKRACDQTLPVSDSTRHQALVLICRVNSYLKLRAGDRVRMVVLPHHPLQLLESSIGTYIRIVRLA